jgi:hypothetical protein
VVLAFRSSTPVRAACALVVAVVCAFGVFPQPVSAEGTPRVELAPTVVTLGEWVTVTGSDWEPGSSVQVQFCGASAVNLSADCVPATTVTGSVGPDGTFTAKVMVTAPPRSCPCVIMITQPQSQAARTYPLSVTDLPTSGTGQLIGVADLQVEAHVVTRKSVTAFFGSPAPRVLVVDVTNPGTQPVNNAVVTASMEDGTTIDARTAEQIDPGATVSVRMPFELPPLSRGHVSVTGAVTTGGASVPFATGTSTTPWGILLVALVLLQLVLLAIRNRVRARRERALAAESSADDLTAGSPEDVLVPVGAAAGSTSAGVADENPAAARLETEEQVPEEQVPEDQPPRDYTMNGPVTAAELKRS